MNVFDEMGNYWAEIADQNQTVNQLQFIKRTLKTKGLILDVACGTGRHLIPLSKEGFDIVGLDVSLNLLKIAKNRWSGAQIVRGDMRFLPFKPKAFSAAVSIDTSFGYLPSEQEDLQSLDELHSILSMDGVLIVDVFNRESLIQRYKDSSQSKCLEYPTFFLWQERTVDAKGDRLHDLWITYDKATQVKAFEHSVRLYEFNRLQGLLEQAGFEPNSCYGDYKSESFSSNSSRLIFVSSPK